MKAVPSSVSRVGRGPGKRSATRASVPRTRKTIPAASNNTVSDCQGAASQAGLRLRACQAPGSVCDEFVYLHDLFPTFMEIAGLGPTGAEDSKSILGQVLGRGEATGRESIYSSFYSQIFPYEQRMVRTHRHKLVYNRSDIGELYDLVADPWEMRNLIDMPETKVLQNELLDTMRAHMVRLGDPLLGFFDQVRPIY